MKSKITSAINMRKIQNIAQAKHALAIVEGYCTAESINPTKANRSDYLAIRRWLRNIATVYGYSSLQEEARGLQKSIELTLRKANHCISNCISKRTRKFQKNKSHSKKRR